MTALAGASGRLGYATPSPMRLLALLVLAPLLSLTGGHASVTVSGSNALSFSDGHAYVLSMDGFGVLALATAPLVDGAWDRESQPFGYVEVRVYGGIEEGTIEFATNKMVVGSGAAVTVQHWPADGPVDEGYRAQSGTLTFESVTESRTTGTLSASLLADDGTEATLDATFEAVPGNIPPP